MSITFTEGLDSVELPNPEFGYQTIILLPFDFIELDNGKREIRDYGVQYDKRFCKLTFINTITQQTDFESFYADFYISGHRGKSVKMTLDTDSNFFPFGCDKGDVGDFQVSLQQIGTPKIFMNPFRYFKMDLLITNVGDFPSYNLPAEIDEGNWTFGSVDKLLMPQNLFEPDRSYALSIVHTEKSFPQYFCQDAYNDTNKTNFIQLCNESKCAALLSYITNTVRSNNVTCYGDDYYHMFGTDYPTNDEAGVVQLNTNEIIITHKNFDRFEINLSLRQPWNY